MIKYYRHKPTGWVYSTDPECCVYLISEGGSRIPASLAVFPGQTDWIEFTPASFFVDESGGLILIKEPC